MGWTQQRGAHPRGVARYQVATGRDTLALDDAGKNCNELTIDELSFVQRPEAPGVATSRMPPSERLGHGLVLSKHAKAVEIATKALAKVTSLPDGKGGKKIPVAEWTSYRPHIC